MPEGDTVYRAAKRLNEALAGDVLTRCDLRVPAYATVDLSGETVLGVASRGKHLLARIGEFTVHSHLKMEGEWRLYRPGARWRGPSHQVRAVLGTASWNAVGTELGVLEVLPTADEVRVVGHLGPDLLGPDWNATEAARRIGEHPHTPIAVALLDQRNLAGLGNEYVNELCFLRGMLPTTPVAGVDVTRTIDLAHRLITANRDRPVRTTTGDTRRGNTSWVYGRDTCRRCGTRLARGELGRTELEARVTYVCPHCQH